MEMSPADADNAETIISHAKVLCCQLEIPEEANLRAMKIAKQHKGSHLFTTSTIRKIFSVTTIFNPAPGLEHLDKYLLQHADIVCPNENEVNYVTNSGGVWSLMRLINGSISSRGPIS